MENKIYKDFDGPIKIIKLENEDYTSYHSHEFLEFVYIVDGTASYNINGNSGILKKGNFFVIDYETAHSYFSKNKDLTVINCLFLPEFVDKNLAGVNSFNKLTERYFFGVTGRKIKGPTADRVYFDDGIVGTLFSRMYTEYREQKDGFTEIIRYALCAILIQIVRQVGSDKVISELIAQVIKETEKGYMQHISLKTICKKLHYSLPYISKKFKEEIGITFTDHLQNRRIEESCRLLTESDANINEIAEQVGYSNIKFFNKTFRKVTKITPREYRKIYKKY